MKLKKGDNVKVIKGKDKGKTGKVEKVFVKLDKVLIANVNMYKRHLKARSQSQPSEIVTLTKPVPSETSFWFAQNAVRRQGLVIKLKRV